MNHLLKDLLVLATALTSISVFASPQSLKIDYSQNGMVTGQFEDQCLNQDTLDFSQRLATVAKKFPSLSQKNVSFDSNVYQYQTSCNPQHTLCYYESVCVHELGVKIAGFNLVENTINRADNPDQCDAFEKSIDDQGDSLFSYFYDYKPLFGPHICAGDWVTLSAE